MPTTLKPPQSVQEAAKRAQKWVAEGFAGSGFTDVGRARMGQLAGGEGVSEETVRRMKAYFDRHVSDKDAPDFDNAAKPSAGRVAWDAWGGDAGRAWAESVVERLEREESAREDGERLDAIRFDDAPAALRRFLAPPSPLPQGGYRVEGVIAVEGVKHYAWGGELVRADALRDPEFLKSLEGLLLTDQHPDALVSPDTAPRVDEGERVLSARWDAEARAVIAVFALRTLEGARGLSIGLHPVRVEVRKGRFDGAEYVAEQVELRANHVARTPSPRVQEAALRVDEKKPETQTEKNKAQAKPEGRRMDEIEIEIDGIKYKVPKAVADAMMRMRSDMDAMRGKEAAGEAKMDSLIKRLDAMQAAEAAASLAALKAKAKAKAGAKPEDAARIDAAKTEAEVYRASLPHALLARLDAITPASAEALKGAWEYAEASRLDTAANVSAQVSAVQAAQRADAAAPKPDPTGRFHAPPKFDRDALAKKGA